VFCHLSSAGPNLWSATYTVALIDLQSLIDAIVPASVSAIQWTSCLADQHGRELCRRVLFCSALSLICELAIIASTFIFLRNEIAWQKWMKDAGHSGGSRDKMAMLIFSLVATACVIFLVIIGRGDIIRGLRNAWTGVSKISQLATSINSSMLQTRLRMFNTSVHPTDKDVDPEQEDEAPSDGLMV
jgi:hypothetical protein